MNVLSARSEQVGLLAKDAAPLRLASKGQAALCTLISIDGPFSRALGAQFAIDEAGETAGDMTGGCLDAALARECANARVDGERRVLRYGQGSPFIDIRLPCGGGLDISIEPFPNAGECTAAVGRLLERQPINMALPLPGTAAAMELRSWQPEERSFLAEDAGIFHRVYYPGLRVIVFGDSPEATALVRLCAFHGVESQQLTPAGAERPGGLFLGQAPQDMKIDPWTAVVLMFHDHDWEVPIIVWALQTTAFYIGALGGQRTAASRRVLLGTRGWDDTALRRVEGPIGLFGPARDADTLALSVLTDLVARYHRNCSS